MINTKQSFMESLLKYLVSASKNKMADLLPRQQQITNFETYDSVSINFNGLIMQTGLYINTVTDWKLWFIKTVFFSNGHCSETMGLYEENVAIDDSRPNHTFI